jgi:formylglycine-generating enzyme required for sulfatase activity
LPTLDEWEYAAMADQNSPDARKKETYNQLILDWYEAPKTFNNSIGSTFKNYWGIYDLHGLVWEWTMDFNSVLISGESRKDVDKDSNLFCGSAAVGASDLMNYAAFMRYAFRGSLKANYSIRNLGFRCAQTKESSHKNLTY